MMYSSQKWSQKKVEIAWLTTLSSFDKLVQPSYNTKLRCWYCSGLGMFITLTLYANNVLRPSHGSVQFSFINQKLDARKAWKQGY